METKEIQMNAMCEQTQSENKFFSEFMPTGTSTGQKTAVQDLEQLVAACGLSSILY